MAQARAPRTGASAMPAESQAPISEWERFLFMARMWGLARTGRSAGNLSGLKRKGRPHLVRPPFPISMFEADQATASKSSSTSTGPESWPLAETSRSTNSMIAIGDASEARGPVLMMRV